MVDSARKAAFECHHLTSLEAVDSVEVDDVDPAWTKQKWWQEQVHTQTEVFFRLNAPERLRAVQALNATHRAVDITSLVGAEKGPFSITSRSWTLLARLRLGQPLDALDTRFCPGCGAAMDCFGDHVLSCHKLGIYARHNKVRNELASICGEIDLRVELEQGPGGSPLRPGDVLVHGLDADPLAVDVGVVHTLQSSINSADVQPGPLAKKMEQRKVLERQALCRRNGWSFSPFAMETIGVWGGKARHLLQKLATVWANHNGCTKREAASGCRSRSLRCCTDWPDSKCANIIFEPRACIFGRHSGSFCKHLAMGLYWHLYRDPKRAFYRGKMVTRCILVHFGSRRHCSRQRHSLAA